MQCTSVFNLLGAKNHWWPTVAQGWRQGGLEGAIDPCRNMLPPSEVEKLFCRRFLAFTLR